MGRKCSICINKQRAEIEEDILDSVPYRDIATKYGVNRMSVQRHAQNGHIEQAIVEAHELKDIVHGKELLDKILYLQQEALTVLQKAKNCEDNILALNAISKAARLLEIQGKIAGLIQQGTQVNINQQQILNIEYKEIIEEVLGCEAGMFLKREYPESLEGLRKHLEGHYDEIMSRYKKTEHLKKKVVR